MPDGKEPITIQVASSMAALSASEWDACAGWDGATGRGNPFVSHAFLSALEESESVSSDTGWLPQHLFIAGPDGRLLAAAPLYLKNHSYGEYVFDWGWADAYERAGGRYYPKLQCSVPFTPVTGPRLLVRPGLEGDTLQAALIAGMVKLAERHQVSSLHITFPTRPEWQALSGADLLPRIGRQYHWTNQGYGSFDDFLASLTSRKRKTIRKERQKVADSDVVIRPLVGDEITERHWAAFYQFYLSTVDKKWAQAYLTEDFFHLLGARLGKAVVMIVAEVDGRPVAGALNLRSDTTLYGRNWGASEDFKFLHFEACYYQAIDFAIANGLERVEAGAQGEHKIQRGYLPEETYSAHWIRDAGFRDAVADFVRRETHGVRHEIDALAGLSPYRLDEATNE